MDKYLEMQAFVAVVDSGSFVRAAGLLQMSKAAVSRFVGNLETRLGVRLLHRTTRRLSLTEQGVAFHARCRELLEGIEDAESEVTSRAQAATGLLKVSAPVSFGVLYLAPLWAEFLALHPKLHLEVTLTDLFVDLVGEGYDVAVRIARLPSSSLVCRKLASTRLVLCASPAYLREHGTPGHPADLAEHRVACYRLQSADTWGFEGPEGHVEVDVRPRFHSNSGDTLRLGAVGHRCIVLLPSFLVADDLRSGALVELLPAFRSIEAGIYALYPSRKHLTAKVRLLVDFLAERFRVQPWSD